MKTSIVLLAALALFGAAPASAARGDGWIGVQFGGSASTGDFERSVSGGPQGGLFGTSFRSEHVGIGVDVAYHSWSGSGEAEALLSALLGSSVDIKVHALQTTAHAIIDLGSRGTARPYFELGCGPYWMKSDLLIREQRLEGNWMPHVGAFLGAGVDFKPNGMTRFGVSGMYHAIQSDDEPGQLFSFGVRLIRGN